MKRSDSEWKPLRPKSKCSLAEGNGRPVWIRLGLATGIITRVYIEDIDIVLEPRSNFL